MWAKIVQSILIPLVKDQVVALIKWVVNWFSERKRKKELKKSNNKKVDDYVKANNADDASDSFSKLP